MCNFFLLLVVSLRRLPPNSMGGWDSSVSFMVGVGNTEVKIAVVSYSVGYLMIRGFNLQTRHRQSPFQDKCLCV